jgi:hypothetical protein
MDILKSLIGDKTMGVLVSGLIGRGFTRDQAERFLPEAGSSVISAIKDTNNGADVDSILGTIDIPDLASKIGVDSSMITNGLKYIIPGLMDLIGGNDVGNIPGKVESFFEARH